MRRPWRRLGLRSRFVVVLVATSLATLAAATLTVFPPLERRLEHDRLSELRGLARTARPALRAVPREELRPGSRRLEEIVEDLQIRTGGRIAIFDAGGTILADTSRRRIGRTAALVARAQALARAHRDSIVATARKRLALVATVIRVEDGDRLTLVLAKPLDDTRAAASVVRAGLPLALVVGLAVSVLLAALFSASLLKRLALLRADARALGDEGLRHQIAVGGTDEVAEVAGALEAMRVRLVEEEASRQAFVATASHELRTPLASLQATLELLHEQERDPNTDADARSARVETALRQTHRLVGLATDLLDLSRTDGDVPLHPEPLDPVELAQTVAREFAPRLDGAGRAHEVVAPQGAPPLVVADSAALVRILRILLDNACAYGAGAVRVAVEPHEETGRVRVLVSDEGPGVAPEESEQVFVRFARGSTAAGRPGFGLGLAIARGLARAMDGDVWAEPGAPGSRFVVELPAWADGD